MRRTIATLLLLCAGAGALAQNRCEVVFLADFLYANNPSWLRAVKGWGATGVTLRVFRSEIETTYHSYDVRFMQACLATIARENLDIYVRVNMNLLRPAWRGQYTADDFHQTRGGALYDNYNYADPGVPMLNLTAPRARGDLLRFVAVVAAELRAQPPQVRNRIRAITPTLSPDDELEYPSARHRSAAGGDFWGWLTGYSRPEREAFILHLRRKYNGSPRTTDARALNAAWGSSFPRIDTASINIDRFDWERLRDSYASFPVGRRDFIEFRTAEMKRFIDSCAAIVRAAGFGFGVQFGSLYDNGIEARGFLDVTPLCERADLFVNGDVPEHVPNFNFVADLQRSIARYWEYRRSQPPRQPGGRMKFGTETNWPSYLSITPNDLVYYWKEQLQRTYDRGGTFLSVSHWGTYEPLGQWTEATGGTERRLERRVADVVLADSLDSDDAEFKSRSYRIWRDALRAFAGSPPKTVNPTEAVLISHESVLYGARPDDAPRYRWKTGVKGGEIQTFDGARRASVKTVEYPLSRQARGILERTRPPADREKPADILTDYMRQNARTLPSRYQRVQQ